MNKVWKWKWIKTMSVDQFAISRNQHIGSPSLESDERGVLGKNYRYTFFNTSVKSGKKYTLCEFELFPLPRISVKYNLFYVYLFTLSGFWMLQKGVQHPCAYWKWMHSMFLTTSARSHAETCSDPSECAMEKVALIYLLW